MTNDVLAGLLFAAGTLLLGFGILIWEKPGIDAAVKKAEDDWKARHG